MSLGIIIGPLHLCNILSVHCVIINVNYVLSISVDSRYGGLLVINHLIVLHFLAFVLLCINILHTILRTRSAAFTRDKARVAIDHCSLIGGDRGYEEAKKILQERFGDEYIIVTNFICTLKKNVYSAEDLRLLSDQLHNAALVMKHQNTYSKLDSQHNLK